MKAQQNRSYLRTVPAPEDDSAGRCSLYPGGAVFRETPPTHLAVVSEEFVPTTDGQFQQALSSQLSLPLPNEQLLTIVNMPRMNTPLFMHFLGTIRPRHILDMRLCPLFSIDHWMNNQRAFALFEKIGARYDNIALFLELKFGVKTENDARLNPSIVATLIPKLPKFFPRSGFPWPLQGPLAFLVDDPMRAVDYQAQMPLALKPAPPGGWNTVILG